MKIELGKHYRTMNGREVRILCVDGPEPGYPVVGIVIDLRYEPDYDYTIWTSSGVSMYSHLNGPDPGDLVETP